MAAEKGDPTVDEAINVFWCLNIDLDRDGKIDYVSCWKCDDNDDVYVYYCHSIEQATTIDKDCAIVFEKESDNLHKHPISISIILSFPVWICVRLSHKPVNLRSGWKTFTVGSVQQMRAHFAVARLHHELQSYAWCTCNSTDGIRTHFFVVCSVLVCASTSLVHFAMHSINWVRERERCQSTVFDPRCLLFMRSKRWLYAFQCAWNEFLYADTHWLACSLLQTHSNSLYLNHSEITI